MSTIQSQRPKPRRSKAPAKTTAESLIEIARKRVVSKPKGRKKAAGGLESLRQEISRLSAEVPDEVWATLPTDLSKNVDHYLYGVSRVEE